MLQDADDFPQMSLPSLCYCGSPHLNSQLAGYQIPTLFIQSHRWHLDSELVSKDRVRVRAQCGHGLLIYRGLVKTDAVFHTLARLIP